MRSSMEKKGKKSLFFKKFHSCSLRGHFEKKTALTQKQLALTSFSSQR